MFRGLLVVCAAMCAAVVIAVPSASAQPHMMVGFLDQASTFYNAEATFPTLKKLHAQVVRADLYWGGGGAVAVATHKPKNAQNPNDPAYNWAPYDHFVQVAAKYKVKILFTIWGTPGWANGGKPARWAPTKPVDLQNFAYAAARHFSGTNVDDERRQDPAGAPVDCVERAEPALPALSAVQADPRQVRDAERDQLREDLQRGLRRRAHDALLRREGRVRRHRAAREQQRARQARHAVPQSFMIAVRKAGLKKFDAYAHNPYNGPHELPTTKPHTKGAYTLGNIDAMIAQVTKLWGRKRIWLTEYAYQTNPPDRVFGVSYAKQAAYLKQAFAIARKQPRIDMMLWFQVKDEPGIGGWQSGLITSRGKKKPAYVTYSRLPH